MAARKAKRICLFCKRGEGRLVELDVLVHDRCFRLIWEHGALTILQLQGRVRTSAIRQCIRNSVSMYRVNKAKGLPTLKRLEGILYIPVTGTSAKAAGRRYVKRNAH